MEGKGKGKGKFIHFIIRTLNEIVTGGREGILVAVCMYTSLGHSPNWLKGDSADTI